MENKARMPVENCINGVKPEPLVTMRVVEPGFHVEQFRFVPDSYLASIGPELDSGLDKLLYLRLFVEDETEDAF
jgi:hypothetical protein